MNQATLQIILALIPVASELIFNVGGKLIKLNTADITKPEDIVAAFDAARAEGFPKLTF